MSHRNERQRPFALATLAALATLSGAGTLLGGACSAADETPSSSSSGDSSTSTGSGGAGGQGGGATTATTTSSATSGTGGMGSGGNGGSGGTLCPSGSIVCEGTVAKVCDGNGGFTSETECAPKVCAPGIGCSECVPGEASCSGNVSTVCKGDGSGYLTFDCDPVQGVTCNPATGYCEGACAPQGLGQSFVGCDYYPTVLPNVVSTNPFTFAVAISNTTASPANVTVTQGAANIATTIVPANDVTVLPLPWVSATKDAFGSTTLAPKAAYRLRSDQPVTVYQYNPLEYVVGNSYSYTNDASILFPVNTWTGDYMVAALQTLSTGLPGYYAVTASEDNTTVVLTAPPAGGTIAAGAGVAADGSGTVIMNQGDVLLVLSGGSGSPGDVTGTIVTADKSVQIIGGHVCTYMPDPVCCCDHIEEAVPPLDTLSTDYVVTAPVLTGGGGSVNNVVRIIATADNTTLSYEPAIPGAPAAIATKGGHVEFETNADFRISASSQVIVVQYMEGESGVGAGDPAMTLGVPEKQYRSSYLFHAPTSYAENFVNVVAKTNDTVNLDGVAIAGFSPIGNSGYSVARVALSNAGNGTHTMDGASPFGISVYGYGEYTSYWYPGGQNLQHF